MEMRLKMKQLAYLAQSGWRALKPGSVAAAVILAMLLGPWAIALAAGADMVGNATVITLPVVDDTTDNTSATRDLNEVGTCGSYRLPPVNTRSLWYKYAATGSGWLTVDTRNSTYDTVLEVYTSTIGSPGAGDLVSVGCNDDIDKNTRQSQVTVHVTASVTYYIMIRNWGDNGDQPSPIGPGTAHFNASFSAQQQLYVSTTGDDTSVGSSAAPFRHIQHAVDVASAAGDTVINVATGAYGEDVVINKTVKFVGTGGPTTASFTLTNGALLAPGTSGISAPVVNVNQTGAAGAKIQDAISLVSAGGRVNVDTGVYTETVAIGKSLTLQGPASVGAMLQPAISTDNAINITSGSPVTVTRLTIQNATIGISVTAGSGQHTIVGNNFYTNTAAVDSSVSLNAVRNWWASDTGPSVGTNQGGTGQGTTGSGSVTFSPWCTSPAPACTPLAGIATRLSFATSPGSGQVNLPLPTQPVLRAEDAGGNLGINFASPVTVTIKPGTGTVGASLGGITAQVGVRGVITFTNLYVDQVGQGYVLSATASALPAVSSLPFNITADQLSVAASPTHTMADATLSPAFVVRAVDGHGNIDTTFNSTVTVGIKVGTNPLNATLAGTIALKATNGVATFTNLAINYVGQGYVLTATAAGLTGTESLPFNVTAKQLVFATQPSDAAAGAQFPTQPVVRAEDAHGNVDPTFAASVAITIGVNPHGNGLLSGIVLTPAVNGVITYTNLSIDKSGVGYTLVASKSPLISGTSQPFTVTGGLATHLFFSVQPPGNSAADSNFNYTVQALDNNDNVSPMFNGPITVTLLPAGATLSGITVTTAINGVAMFTSSVNYIGTGYVLSATAPTLADANSTPFNITAKKLVFRTSPSDTTAGAVFTSVVSAEDDYNNVDLNFGSSVNLNLLNPAGAVLGGSTSVSAHSGVITFTNFINKVGVGYVLSATSGSLISGASTPFAIIPGAATHLVFSSPLTTATAGSLLPVSPVVRAEDANGNLATAFSDVITAAIAVNPSGTGKLSGILTATAASGVVTFTNLSIDKVGVGYVLSFTTTSGITSTVSNAFTVIPGTPTTLVFQRQPSDARVLAWISPAPVVKVQDDYGNLATNFTNPVTLTIGSGGTPGAILTGTASVPAVGGVVTYTTVAIDKVGLSYVLSATAPTLVFTTSVPITITPATAQVLLTNTVPAYTGSPLAIVSSTVPPGLTLVLTYTGTGSTTYGPALTPPTAAGTYTVTAVVSDTDYIGFNASAWTIRPFTATVTLDLTPVYYNTLPQAVGSSTSPAGLTLTTTYSGTSGTAYGPSQQPPTNAGAYTVTAAVTGTSNYVGSAAGVWTIRPFTATVLVTDVVGVYTGLPQAIISSTAPGSLPVTVVYTGTGSSTYGPSANPPSNAGTYSATVTVNSANYWGNATGSVIIQRANQTITFDALSDRPYSPISFTVTATATSGLPVSFAASGGACSMAGARSVTMTGVGTCTITARQAGNTNYAQAADVPQSFTILRASQSITFAPLVSPRLIGEPPFVVTATASSGLPVSFTTSGPCSVIGNLVSVGTTAGTCWVYANQGGDANYNAALEQSQSFAVVSPTQTINFPALADKALGDPPFVLSATTAPVLQTVTFSSGTPTVCSVVGTTASLLTSGSCSITASSAGALPVTRTFLVSPAASNSSIYLPAVLSNYSALPDLVASLSLSPDKSSYGGGEAVLITVIVTNRGNSPAGAFWVDFYVNPSTPPAPPVTISLPWDRRGCTLATCYGISWYVAGPLAPGQSIALTSTPGSYDSAHTRWPGYLPSGATDLYAFADSWNCNTTTQVCVPTGAVLEGNENNNRAERHGLSAAGLSSLEAETQEVLVDFPPRPPIPDK